MIYDVFLPFIIIFSIFSIIIILARKIPDISLETETKKDWLAEEAKKQHRATVLFCAALSILEKTLRQLRIHILKLDAKIFTLIQYLREKSAKKLEEINKFSYKSFTPAAAKKADKLQFLIKPQPKEKLQAVEKPQPSENFRTIEKEIFKAASVKPAVAMLPAAMKGEKAPNQTASSDIIKAPRQRGKFQVKYQFKEEERKLLHIIAGNPKNAENYKKLGAIYCENENFLDAEAAFNEYLKLNPSDSKIRETLKKIIRKNKNQNKENALSH